MFQQSNMIFIRWREFRTKIKILKLDWKRLSKQKSTKSSQTKLEKMYWKVQYVPIEQQLEVWFLYQVSLTEQHSFVQLYQWCIFVYYARTKSKWNLFPFLRNFSIDNIQVWRQSNGQLVIHNRIKQTDPAIRIIFFQSLFKWAI